MIRNLESKIENLKSEGSTERAGTGGSGDSMIVVMVSYQLSSKQGKKISGRIFIWLLAMFMLTAVVRAEAQQTAKISRIAFLGGSTASALSKRLEAFPTRSA